MNNQNFNQPGSLAMMISRTAYRAVVAIDRLSQLRFNRK